MTIQALSARILSTRQRRLLGTRPVFRRYSAVSHDDLLILQQEVGADLPAQLVEWLSQVGYGDLGDDLSFRKELFVRVTSGDLTGAIIFAQDILGSFYAFDASGRIYHFPRFEPTVAFVADDFLTFLEELVRRDYTLVAWMDTLKSEPYAW